MSAFKHEEHQQRNKHQQRKECLRFSMRKGEMQGQEGICAVGRGSACVVCENRNVCTVEGNRL
jgi:hypothetical protein